MILPFCQVVGKPFYRRFLNFPSGVVLYVWDGIQTIILPRDPRLARLIRICARHFSLSTRERKPFRRASFVDDIRNEGSFSGEKRRNTTIHSNP
jgi:hypothetical protein